MISSIIFGVLSLLVIIYLINAYNKGIILRNYVREAFSTMDVYMKKRWDLIPNLVETAKGYMTHEQNTLTKIAELRNQNYGGMSNEQKMDVNAQLGLGLAKLIAVAENYPDLKANENFLRLMEELSQVEEDIANSRKYYNGTVREFNNFTELFPTNIIAMIFNFKAEKMYEISDAERENVKVSF
ncbi:MAG: LemA family protein [Candidatus Gastranaerophilales bacterium]|nr:LemA family protein [Candidatus Gastranaerophilales bacterium]